MERFPVTLELTLLSVLIAVTVGVSAGVLSAIYRNSAVDLLARLFALIGLAAPNFLVGTLIIYVLSVYFGILPNAGDYVEITEDPLENLGQLFFPALTLGLSFSASVMRMTRSAVLEVLGEDYIGIEMGYLLGGTVIIEQIFALPGLGRLALNAISQRDYALIQGVTLFIAINFVLINILVDLIYAALDPRITYADPN
jgi:peptide/nickel transport system permease protein